MDEAGNAYVTGRSTGSGSGPDYLTIKYDAGGNRLWTASYNGPSNDWDIATSIAIDPRGNAYVTGYSYRIDGWPPTEHTDYATIKYDANGNQLWVIRFSGFGGFLYAYAIAADEAGNAYVTGNSHTIKYDTNGNQIWATVNQGDEHAIALDDAGNIYVTGWTPNYFNFYTIKFDGNGSQLWAAFYNGPASGSDKSYSIAVDDAGNAYITGESYGGGTSFDYASIKYDTNGNQIWITRYAPAFSSTDVASSITLDNAGNAYVTGKSNGNYATIKYSGGNIDCWMPVETMVLGQPLPQEFALHQNYPNPFNARTVLSYQLPVASSVRLQVYDTAGRLVETLVDGRRSAGVHELTWDASALPSGMYVCRIQAGEWTASGKMMFLK